MTHEMNEIVRKQHLSFRAFCGLEAIVVNHHDFEQALQERIDENKDNKFRRRTTSNDSQFYPKIRIADTFFSDTFPLNKLSDLINIRQTHNLQFQFLLLKPFSTLAKIRANALRQNRPDTEILIRFNRGIKKIINAFLNRADDFDPEYESNKNRITYSVELLERLLSLFYGKNMEIKFTDEYTDLPFYMIGPFVFKGIIFPNSSASNNPWSIYVDDPLQTDDMFSTLEKSFEYLWTGNLSFTLISLNFVIIYSLMYMICY